MSRYPVVVVVVAAVLLALALPAHAENWADNPDYADHAGFARSRAVCDQLRAVALPAGNRADRRKQGGMDGCDSEALYYGIGMPADPEAAFRCAQLEDGGDMFGGDMMLATIYANGRGAPRDLDKAIAIACRTGWAPAEFDGRVSDLDDYRQQGDGPADFHWCDAATSGYMSGFCASHDARIAAARRMAGFQAFAARWNQGEAKARLEALITAAENFTQARGVEIDQTGTLRGAFVVMAEEEVRALLHQDLQAVAEFKPSLALALADRDADAELNRVYKRVMAFRFDVLAGSPTHDGIRKVQRAWLKYRDAWGDFVRTAAPEVSPQAMANLQTRHRIKQLRGVLHED